MGQWNSSQTRPVQNQKLLRMLEAVKMCRRPWSGYWPELYVFHMDKVIRPLQSGSIVLLQSKPQRHSHESKSCQHSADSVITEFCHPLALTSAQKHHSYVIFWHNISMQSMQVFVILNHKSHYFGRKPLKQDLELIR